MNRVSLWIVAITAILIILEVVQNRIDAHRRRRGE